MTDTSRETVEALANALPECNMYAPRLYTAAETLRALLDERDHSAALVAAAYQAAGDAVNEADSLELATKGTGDIDARIRALTPADAQAALDALIQKAVAEERERCARVALAYHDRHARGYGAVGNSPDEKAHHTHGEVIAAAIREGNA